MVRDEKTEEQVGLRDDQDAAPTNPVTPKTKARLATQIVATAITSLAPLCMGYSFGFSSPAGPDLENRLGLDTDQVAWFSSLVTLGAMAGSPIGAFLVERLGRKASLILLNVPIFLGWLLVILAECADGRGFLAMLYIGRILQGLAVGIICSAQPVYIAEITTKEHRGRLATSFQLCVNSGIMLSYLVGMPLYYRWMAIVPLALSALMTGLMFLLPESPRFLLSRGHKSKAVAALKWLRGPDYDIQDELQQTQDTLDAHLAIGSFHPREFLTPALYRPLIISLIVMIFQDACGINAVFFYSESILESAGFQGKGALASVVLAIIFVLTIFPAGLLTDRAGRKILLIVSQAVMAVSLVTMGLYYFLSLEKNIGGLNWLSMGSLIVYISAFSLGMGPIAYVVMAEVIPLRARGLGMGIAIFIHWLVAFVITKNFKAMVGALFAYGAFWFFAGLTVLGLVLTIWLIPETKGRSLEEIEQLFTGRSNIDQSNSGTGKIYKGSINSLPAQEVLADHEMESLNSRAEKI